MSEIELALAGSCNVMSDVRKLSSSSLSVRSNRYAPSRHNQIVLGFGLVTCVKWYQGSSANRGVACVRRRCGRVQVGRDSGCSPSHNKVCCVDGLFSFLELETLHVLYVMWLKDVRALNTNCTLKNYGLGAEVCPQKHESWRWT